MTDEELVARLRSGLDNADRGADGIRELGGVVLTMNDAADRIEDLAKQLALVTGQRTRIKNTLVNLLLSADRGDQEEIAWAIQLVRDDIAREGESVNGR